MEPAILSDVFRQRLLAQLQRAAEALTDGGLKPAEVLAIVRNSASSVVADVELVDRAPAWS
jgi:hypothetical protein